MTRHLALVGPTATGKSALALEIARAAGDVEIVSLDSMQVYREMDIGTAKPTRAELAEVRHHLVDVADPSEAWSVARAQELARAAIADIEMRDKRAVLVGGTGLYVHAVVDGLTLPGEDLPTRAALFAATADDDGLAAAYARLRALDPDAAARIEPGNQRRIVRALEVIETSGRPFSSFGPGLQAFGPPAISVALVGRWVSRAVLADRIEQRFAAMAGAGLIDEVRVLAARPGGIAHTAEQAIGYREVLAFVRGEIPSEAAAFDLAVRRTRQFARRQRVWFRRDPRIRWLAAEKLTDLTAAVLATWSNSVPAPLPLNMAP